MDCGTDIFEPIPRGYLKVQPKEDLTALDSNLHGFLVLSLLKGDFGCKP
jgi:hypothetical protein